MPSPVAGGDHAECGPLVLGRPGSHIEALESRARLVGRGRGAGLDEASGGGAPPDAPDLARVLLLMSKVCHSCGKGPAFGQSRSHSMVATKRRFNPNLQKVRVLVKGTPSREYTCTRCLKAGKVVKAV